MDSANVFFSENYQVTRTVNLPHHHHHHQLQGECISYLVFIIVVYVTLLRKKDSLCLTLFLAGSEGLGTGRVDLFGSSVKSLKPRIVVTNGKWRWIVRWTTYNFC